MQAYQWPENFNQLSDSVPAFIKKAIAAREIRISDDYATVYTPTDNVTAKPGDFVIQDDEGNLHVTSAVLFYALTGHAPPADPHNAQVEGADVDPPDIKERSAAEANGPPYSSGVLARSATARARQAAYDAQQQGQQQGRLDFNDPAA
jgi:hypothetical protein